MAITKVGSDVTATVTTGNTDNVSLPSGLQQNDIVVVALASDSDIDPSRPRGIASSEGYTDILHTTTGTPGIQVAWKRMGATPDTTVEVRTETGAALDIAVVIQAWRGVDTTTAIDATAATASGASGLPNPPSYTTATNNALRIIVGGIDDDQVTDFTAPSGYSNMVSLAIGVSNTGCSVVMASKIQATAGAEDPAAFTGTGSDNWQATHFALRPASASNPTLTASGGTYTETGTAATLKRSRLFSCGSGSYTETGTAATFNKGRSLSLENGSYTETGTAATLKFNHKLSLSSASYTETGTAATLNKGRLLSLQGTSYTQTGTSASLEKGYEVASGSGSYNLTGSSATLTYNTGGGVAYSLVLDSGSFSETGTAASLKKGYEIAPSNVLFFISWLNEVNLNYGFSATLEEGVISYTPGLTEILRGYSVSNEGSYTTTGTDATFNRTFVITNDNGSFTETGSDASLKYGKYFLAGDASYVETGSDATFTYRQEIASEEGSFIVSGSSVTYRRTYIFDVSGNSFGLTGKNLILTIPPFSSTTTTVSRIIYETTTETGSLFEETSAIPVETLYGTSTEAGTLYETSADPDPQEIIYGETAG